MPINRDAIGARGEAIVENLLTRRYRRSAPLFRPQFLGEKYPTIDFFVELVDAGGTQTPFFLAQAKTTSTGYNAQRRLRVQVPRNKMSGLVKYPAPTYVVGVDEVDERAFIMAAVLGGAAYFSSFPVTYPLGEERILMILFEEVQTFWQSSATAFTGSRFT